MLSLNYENINYVLTQILKLSCVSFSCVSISYVLALFHATTFLVICNIYFISILEIKPYGLGSRIGDMEAKRRLKGIMDLISWWIFGKQNWRCGMNQTLSLIVPKSAQPPQSRRSKMIMPILSLKTFATNSLKLNFL